MLNFIGQQFSFLKVVSLGKDRSKEGRRIWECLCICGNMKKVTTKDLIEGNIKSCGCRQHLYKDLIGKKFGYLLVLEREVSRNGRSYWKCKCDCGNICIINSKWLINGRTKSCGCYRQKLLVKRATKHGMSETRFCKIWYKMLQRCLNPNDAGYKDYGGRGITVCDRWLKFENFRDDMLIRYNYHIRKYGEQNTSIDRKNVNGNYEPSNCKWATDKEQARHTTVFANTKNYVQHNFWRNKLSGALNTLVRTNYSCIDFCSNYLGMPSDEFKYYIQIQFLPGMTWDNHGKGYGKWQLDHIIGCNNFDLSKLKDRIECFNYKNFQPIWYNDHIKKSIKKRTKV
jgi:hypothetical protein